MMLVFLQNAYYPKGTDLSKLSNKRIWYRLLWRSHTGKRLREILPEDIPFEITEASPSIGEGPDSVFPPDLSFIQAEILRYGPSYIVACGRIAHEGLEKLGVTHKFVPHPAWRFLSKEMTSKIRQEIKVEYAQNQSVHPL